MAAVPPTAMSRRALYIVNPAAGGGRAQERWKQLAGRLGHPGASVEFTNAPGHAFEIARRDATQHGLVVAVGGDGTVRETASGLIAARAEAALGILPIGTGNDFAHQVGLPNVEAALDALDAGAVRKVDAIRVEARRVGATHPEYALVYAAAGAAGDVLRGTTPGVKRWFGRAGAYSVGFLRSWWRMTGRRMTVRHALGEHRGRVLLVAAGNCESAGGGAMCLSPGADPADGQMEITLAPHLPRLRLLRYFAYVVRGTHPGKPGIEYFRSPSVEIDAEEPVEVQADGDAVGFTPARFAIQPQALRVLAQNP